MSAFDWFLVAWWVFSAFTTICMVGKPRKPTEPVAAAIATLITLGLIVGLLLSRGAL